MKSNFLHWYEEADIAIKDEDGKWYDAEDGLYFDSNKDYAPKRTRAKKALSQKAQDARTISKLFGAKALTGTAKQKEWAEKIRADKLQSMSEEQAVVACDKKGILNGSKFWIENREKAAKEIGQFAIDYKQKLSEFYATRKKVLVNELKQEDLEAAANAYNSLTALWGF